MIWQYQLFIILMPFAAAVILVCISTSWKWRITQKGKTFIASQLCALGFLIFNTLELMAVSPAMTVFFMKTSFVFLVLLPPIWLLFSRHYIGRPLKNMGWIIFVLPIVTLALVWTNESLHWFWTGYNFIPIKGMLAIRTEYGFWFMVNVFYSHIMLISGTIAILVYFVNFPRVYRYQTRLIVYGIVVPVLYNLLSISRIFPIQKDFSPIALAFPAMMFTISMVRYRLMDLTPVSRTSVVEHLQDGVIIIDKQNRILDINYVAKKLLQLEKIDPIGVVLQTYLPEWVHASENSAVVQDLDFQFHLDGKFHKYKLEVDPQGEENILIFRDVTETDKLVEDMQALAASDPLTGILNRRYLFELGEKTFDLAVRYRRQLSLLLIDIDHLEQINNQEGRKLGDEVLCSISRYCQQNLRNSDLAARYGGDEFVILLPETTGEQAYKLAERLRKELNGLNISSTETAISISMSIGISSLSTPEPVVSLERLIDQAEQALYQAKRRGGNQTIIWKQRV
jgi:diguanylate cyclase (GGDEF)-like protein